MKVSTSRVVMAAITIGAALLLAGCGSTVSLGVPAPPVSAPEPAPTSYDRAQGTVEITSSYPADLTLVKTTRLLSADGKVYRLAQEVVIPARGRVSAIVYADQNGPAYAIDPTSFSIPGLDASFKPYVTATSTSVFVMSQPPSGPMPIPAPPEPTPAPAPVPPPTTASCVHTTQVTFDPSEETRMKQIMVSVLQGGTDMPTPDVYNEFQTLLNSHGVICAEDIALTKDAMSAGTVCNKLFYQDALISVRTSQSYKSPERLDCENKTIIALLPPEKAKARIQQNEYLMSQIAAGLPISTPNGDVIFTEKIIQSSLDGIDSALVRVDKLFSSNLAPEAPVSSGSPDPNPPGAPSAQKSVRCEPSFVLSSDGSTCVKRPLWDVSNYSNYAPAEKERLWYGNRSAVDVTNSQNGDDSVCKWQYGDHSRNISVGQCVCDAGFGWSSDGSTCVKNN